MSDDISPMNALSRDSMLREVVAKPAADLANASARPRTQIVFCHGDLVEILVATGTGFRRLQLSLEGSDFSHDRVLDARVKAALEHRIASCPDESVITVIGLGSSLAALAAKE